MAKTLFGQLGRLRWPFGPAQRNAMPAASTNAATPREPAAVLVRLLGGVLVFATFLAYGNTLQAPFVYDDILAIPGNPTIRRLWPLTDVLLPQADGGLTVSGRPILNLSFALNYAISGTEVWSYHVFNILVHAAAGLLLFGIIRRTLARRGLAASPAAASVSEWTDTSAAANPTAPPVPPLTAIRNSPVAASVSEWTIPPLAGARSYVADARPTPLAFIIALLWTLHPLHTQAVTYTVQRAESLTGFFYLLTLYAFLRATKCHLLNDTSAAPASRGGGARCHLIDDTGPAAGRWRSLSVGACLLGMATKEIMATAPLVVLLFDRTFVAGSFNAAWRARRGYYLALAATWLLLAALVASTGGNRGGTAGLGVGVPLWAYPLTQFEAIARYVGLAVWPHPLVFEYGTFWVQRASDVLPFAVVVLSLLAATAVALRRWPVAGFLGAAFFLILSPTSLTPGTIQMIVEHRMYLPLAAVLTAAGLTSRRFLPARVVVAAGFAAAIAFVLLTVRRNHDYRSHVALWTDTIAKRPENPRAHEGLAEAWAELGQPARALAHRAEAIRLRPTDATYHYNLGLTQMTAGQLEDAARSFESALRLNPREPRAHNNLAIVLGRLGRRAEALAHYTEAVRLQPGEAQYHENFALALYRAGRIADAIAQFEAALRLRPDHAATRNSLAAAHYELGNAALDAGRLAEAATHFAAAIQHRPDHAESHHNLGVAYARQERWAEARREFETALRLKPDYAEARRNLEQLGALIGR